MTIRYSMGLLISIITMHVSLQASDYPLMLPHNDQITTAARPALDYARNFDLDNVRSNLDSVITRLQQLRPVAEQIIESIEPRVYAAVEGLEKRGLRQEDFDTLYSMLISLNLTQYIDTFNALLPQIAGDLLDQAMSILDDKLPVIQMVQSMAKGTIPVSMQRQLDTFLVSAQELPTLIKRAIPTLQKELNALRPYAKISPNKAAIIVGTLKQLADSKEVESLHQRLNDAVNIFKEGLRRLPSRETIVQELQSVEALINRVQTGKSISIVDAQKIARAIKTVRSMVVDLFKVVKSVIDIPLIINAAAKRIQEVPLPAEVQNTLKIVQDKVGTIADRLVELNDMMNQALNTLKSELQKQLR